MANPLLNGSLSVIAFRKIRNHSFETTLTIGQRSMGSPVISLTSFCRSSTFQYKRLIS